MKITDYKKKEFLRIWHSYHAKYKMAYSHEEAQMMFEVLRDLFLIIDGK